ncbi:MAG: hypothetical protein QNK32_09605 [Porticoccus sp.]|nr:hypothetical protein [Porticoccus sp.]
MKTQEVGMSHLFKKAAGAAKKDLDEALEAFIEIEDFLKMFGTSPEFQEKMVAVRRLENKLFEINEWLMAIESA